MSFALPPTGSLYADSLIAFIADFRRAIAGEFSWQLPFQAYDLFVEDRNTIAKQGQLLIETFDVNTDRPDLDLVRNGGNARSIPITFFEQVAFDSYGLSDDEASTRAEQIFLSEAIAFEHRLGNIKASISGPEWITDIERTGPIDPRRSVSLKDKNTWIIDITTDLTINFIVNADIYGRHNPTTTIFTGA